MIFEAKIFIGMKVRQIKHTNDKFAIIIMIIGAKTFITHAPGRYDEFSRKALTCIPVIYAGHPYDFV